MVERKFSDISEEEWIKFREAVRNARGRMAIIVHPFFPDPAKKKGPDLKSYYNNVQKFLSRTNLPVIIMEEYFQNLDFERRFRNLEGRLLVVPTVAANSVPFLGFKRNNEMADLEYRRFREKLGFVNPKLVLVGGSYAGFAQEVGDVPRKELFGRFCAGELMKNLKVNGFNVKFLPKTTLAFGMGILNHSLLPHFHQKPSKHGRRN